LAKFINPHAKCSISIGQWVRGDDEHLAEDDGQLVRSHNEQLRVKGIYDHVQFEEYSRHIGVADSVFKFAVLQPKV